MYNIYKFKLIYLSPVRIACIGDREIYNSNLNIIFTFIYNTYTTDHYRFDNFNIQCYIYVIIYISKDTLLLYVSLKHIIIYLLSKSL